MIDLGIVLVDGRIGVIVVAVNRARAPLEGPGVLRLPQWIVEGPREATRCCQFIIRIESDFGVFALGIALGGDHECRR